MSEFDGSGNVSPHQTFPRATFEPVRGDPELLPKPTIVRPSRERMPFGPAREQPRGVGAGELKHYGPGPYPDDLFSATDIEALPWRRRRGNEWTDATFRALVLTWLQRFFRAREGQGLIGWDIEEVANGDRMGSVRLTADQQFLRFGVTKRLTEERTERAEVAINFPPSSRADPSERLASVEQSLDAVLVTIS